MPLMNIMKASKKSLTNVEQIKIYMNDMRAVKLTFDKSSTVHAVYDVSDKGYLHSRSDNIHNLISLPLPLHTLGIS